MTNPDADPVDLVTEALARLRGHRGPRPGGAHGHGRDAGPAFGPHGGAPWNHGRGEDPRRGHDPRADFFGGPRPGGPARLRMLAALVAADGPLSVSELATAVGVDQPRASRLVQQGVELGLVERQPDPEDARRTRIGLTARGRELATELRSQRRELVSTALGALSSEEQAEFVRLLSKFAAAWPDR